MLDFTNLIDSVGGLAEETIRRGDLRRRQLEIALRCVEAQAAASAAFDARLASARQRWLKAQPVVINRVWREAVPASAVPDCYTALACDGSQIPLDRHEIAPFLLLNIGKVALHYGCGSRPLLTSAAQLFYSEDELLPVGSGGESPVAVGSLRDEMQPQGYATEKELAARRFLLEIEALGEMIEHAAETRAEIVAYVDGTLILWTQESEQKLSRERTVGRFLTVLDQARSRRVPVVGYLSCPASREVIGALRTSLCADECLSEKECRLPDAPRCAVIDRLTDAELFAHLLAPGERSPLFHSESRILDSYTPREQRIVFFYLNVGGEIARIELPLWAAQDETLLARCHSVSLDQAAKGFGYPVCLSEAHEQAVVRAPEREALLRMIERAFVRSDLPIARTAKAAAKRRRTV